LRYSNELLGHLYDKTAGRCHICRRALVQSAYGLRKSLGGWEIDHSRARAKGGSNSRRNLYPACVSCNRSKQARSTRAARRVHGYRTAPLSRRALARRRGRAIFGLTCLATLIGSFVARDLTASGAMMWGLAGALLGALISIE